MNDITQKAQSMFVTQMTYRIVNGQLILYAFGRKQDGTRGKVAIMNTHPYFFAEEMPDGTHPLVKGVELDVSKTAIGEKTLNRIYVKYPPDVPKIRGSYTHHEADVVYTDRMRYDLGIKDGITWTKDVAGPGELFPVNTDILPQYFVIDLETDGLDGPIMSMAIYDSFQDRYYIVTGRKGYSLSTIKSMMSEYNITSDIKIKYTPSRKGYFDFLQEYCRSRQPDAITGWNIKDFDMPVLQREKPMGVDLYYLNEIAEMDCLHMYDIYKPKRLSRKDLHSNAIEELGIGKIYLDRMLPQEMARVDVNKFLFYNLMDCYLVDQMIKKLQLIKYFTALAKESGTQLGDLISSPKKFMKFKRLSTLKIVENTIMHHVKSNRPNIVIPSRIKHEKAKGVGGYTHSPPKGLHYWVSVLDLKTLYPAIIRMGNISPDTKVDNSFDGAVFTAPNGARFRLDKRGIIPELLDEFVEFRARVKEDMRQYNRTDNQYDILWNKQFALKTLTNSFIGALKQVHFKLYDPDCFNAVTTTAQMVAKHNVKMVGLTYDVIYADTDSVLFKTGETELEKILALNENVENELNASYAELSAKLGLEEHLFEIRAEKVYEKYFQSGREEKGKEIGKKRYAGLVAWKDGEDLREAFLDDRIDIVGYQSVRSDASDYTQNIIETVLTKILTESLDEVKKYLHMEFMKFVKHEEDVASIGLPSTLTRDFKEYVQLPIHARAAKFSNYHFNAGFKAGDKLKYYYVKHPGTDVVAVGRDEVPSAEFEVDWDKMLERCLLKPCAPIVAVLELDSAFRLERSIFDYFPQEE